MGYGVIGEHAGQLILSTPPSSTGYGTTDSKTKAVLNLPHPDVSIHCAMTFADVTHASGIVHHGIGIISYVNDGNTINAPADPGKWPAYVFATGCTSYVAAVRISINGGYVRGGHWVQYWGDPGGDHHGTEAKVVADTVTSAQVVYDPKDGTVRHIHEVVDLGGPSDGGEIPDALALATLIGHTGDLEVMTVDPETLRPGIRVDLSDQSLISDWPG